MKAGPVFAAVSLVLGLLLLCTAGYAASDMYLTGNSKTVAIVTTGVTVATLGIVFGRRIRDDAR